jgi:hypothetical protein
MKKRTPRASPARSQRRLDALLDALVEAAEDRGVAQAEGTAGPREDAELAAARGAIVTWAARSGRAPGRASRYVWKEGDVTFLKELPPRPR